MAAFHVTPQALGHIRRLIEEDAIESPLVGVRWSEGSADVVRTPGGEVAWTREEPEWLATVLDLAEVGVWPGSPIQLHGLNFSLRGRPERRDMEGCVLDVEGGKLVVHENAN